MNDVIMRTNCVFTSFSVSQQATRFGDRCLQTIGRCWPHLRSLGVGGAGCGTQGLVDVGEFNSEYTFTFSHVADFLSRHLYSVLTGLFLTTILLDLLCFSHFFLVCVLFNKMCDLFIYLFTLWACVCSGSAKC